MKRMVPGSNSVAVAPQAVDADLVRRGIHLVYSQGRRFDPLPGLPGAQPSRSQLIELRQANRGRVSLALAASAAPAMYGLHLLMAWLHRH